ncbi:MAG: DUF1080 domain-containing protein [Bryobacteraceae bacterium]
MNRKYSRCPALLAAGLLVPLLCPAASGQNRLSREEQKDGFHLLFNGKNLDGWHGDPAVWSVQDGVIVGSTDGHPIHHNTFLIHSGTYSNFILRADIKLRNHNSGIQFRSKELPDYVVTGYQADASEAGAHSAWGNFYEEKGRGRNVMKNPDEGWAIGKTVYRKGDWNSLEIDAEGPHMRIKVNGTQTIEVTDDKASSGVIAFQLHMGQPMRVEFRNIRIKELK